MPLKGDFSPTSEIFPFRVNSASRNLIGLPYYSRRIMGAERHDYFDRHPEELLGPGFAAGWDAAHRVVRVLLPTSYRLAGFLGFVANNLRDGQRHRVGVVTRGRTLLRLPGLTGSDIGKPVYAINPATFTLTQTPCEVGVVVAIQPDFAETGIVNFKRYDDPQPLSLSLTGDV
jgi:hypothetical protein